MARKKNAEIDGKESTWSKTRIPGLLRHKSGRYYGRFTLGGKTRFVPLRTKLMEVARIRHAEERAKVERMRKAARKASEGIANMGDLLAMERARVKARTGIAEKTRELGEGALLFIERTWPEFADLRPEEVTVSAVQVWRDRAMREGTGFRPPGSKGKPRAPSASGFNKAVDAVRRMLDIAVDAAALSGNPLAGRRGVKVPVKPKKPHLPEVATLEQVFAAMERVGGRGLEAALLCRFLAYSGCRLREAGRVRWCDIDRGRGIMHVAGTKTQAAAREVPIIPPMAGLLDRIMARRKEAADYAIDGVPHVEATATVLAVREGQKTLTAACQKVGCPRLTHHDLRDAFATVCIEAGVDIPTVAAWLGHADGGALLMRVYAHHRRAHSVAQAEKVTF